jgi:hypothetical protein
MNTIKKKFPSDYPEQYLTIIYAMSFNPHNVYIEGTYSMRGMLYPSDVDCFEKVSVKSKTLSNATEKIYFQFKEILSILLKMKNVIVGGIIAGLYDNKPLKWNVQEVLKGEKHNIKFYDALCHPSLVKIDVIAYINSLYTEFSNTYQFYRNNTPINKFELFQKHSLDRDIEKYKKDENYFKMAKRIFVKTGNKKLIPLFNSDVGAMNQVLSDIDTIVYILENRAKIPFQNIDNEIDGFINRLGVLDNKKLVNKQNINTLLRSAEKSKSKSSVIKTLNTLHKDINNIVQSETKTFLSKLKISI